jgi:hypothetical protein
LADRIEHLLVQSGKIESDDECWPWRAPYDLLKAGAGLHLARPPDFVMER